MPLEVPCPNCGAKLKAPDNIIGKKVKCKKCDTQFRVPGGPSRPGDSVADPQALSAIAMPAPLPLDDEDDVPMAGAVAPPPPPPKPAPRPSPRDVGALPSADPFDFSAPAAIKPAAKPPASPPPPAAKAPVNPPPARAVPPAVPATPARPAFGAAAKPKSAASPPPPPQPVAKAPSAPAAKVPPPPAKKAAPPPEPEPLPLDDDEPAPEPLAEDPAPAASDPFAFNLGDEPPAPEKGKGRRRDRDEDDDDEDDRPRSRRKGRDRDEDDEDDDPRSRRKTRDRDEDAGDEPQEGRRYVRPDERKSGGTLLIAVLIGLVALGSAVAAVIVFRQQNKETEQAKKDEKKEEKKDDTGTPTPDDGKGGKADPKVDPEPKKEPKVDPVPKKDPVIPGPAVPTLGLAPTILPLKFSPSGTLEVAQKPTGEPLKVESQPGKVKRIFAPADRRKGDVVVVSQSLPDGATKGERLWVEVFAPTGAKVLRVQIDGDGAEAKCDVSPDSKLFAFATPDGKVHVWDLGNSGNPVLKDFDPFTDNPDRKKEGIAGVFFTTTTNHLVVVSTAGFAYLFDTATKNKVQSYGPLGILSPGKVTLGKNLAADPDRGSIVMAVNGVIYQIDTSNMTTAWKLEVGEVGRPLGLAVVGMPGRIAYAFETDDRGRKEKGLLFCLPKEKPQAFRWGETPGEPTGVAWAGAKYAVVSSDKGVAYFEADEKRFAPFAFAELAGGKLAHAAGEDGHWYLAPDPPGRSLLLTVTTDAITDFKNGLDEKNPPTVRLDAQGLWK